MKLIIADDHDLVRDALILLVKRDAPDAQVLGARDFKEAMALAAEHTDLDLVLLDVVMPGMNKMLAVADFIEHYPQVPVALMSGHITQNDVEKAFAMGVKGFIPKTLHGKALMSALHLITSGARYVPDIMLVPGEDNDTSDNLGIALSKRESQVLQLLAQGSSNKVIARNLNIEETTVKLHLRSLFKKFAANNRTEVVVSAMAKGLVNRESP